jgi:hypothetical protein
MAHRLRLLVKIDTNPSTATLAVTGCLTKENCQALLPIIRRLHALVDGMGVTVDLSTAKHIEASAVHMVEQAGPTADAAGDLDEGKVFIILPTHLPSCPALTWDGTFQSQLR